MASYCRITGKARGLPKPNYFPLLPPISPADAKRFCRITGKAYGLPRHHYIPVLLGKPRNKNRSKLHKIIQGYRYFFPCLQDATDLKDILDTKPKNGGDAQYVYTVREKKCSLVFSAELEAAVRDGDVRDVMLAKDNDIILLKLKQGNVSLEMKEVDINSLDGGHLFEGEGVAVRKENNTGLIRKIFEDKEKESETKKKKPKKEARNWKNVETSKIKLPTESFESWEWDKFETNECSSVITRLPTPASVAPISLDLSQSKPGLIQQPYLTESYIGLETVAVVAPFKPLIIEPDCLVQESLKNLDQEALERTLKPEVLVKKNVLPLMCELSRIPETIENGEITVNETNGCIVSGMKVSIDGVERFVVGQCVSTTSGEVFVPGQTVKTSSGQTFVPGFVLEVDDKCKMIPGQIFTVDGQKTFVAGMTTLTSEGEKFVQGQVIRSPNGNKFLPGQTIIHNNEMRFVPGQITQEDRFVPGQIVSTSEGVEFIPGQSAEVGDNIEFIPGQSVWTEKGWEFLPGKAIVTESGKIFVPGKETANGFIPGQYVQENQQLVFVPGKTVEGDILKFVPGMTIETREGPKFVQGQVVQTNSGMKFLPGQTEIVGDEIEFVMASTTKEILFETSTSTYTKTTDIYSDGVFGHMVQSNHGVEFFPGPATALPAGKVVPGKLIRGDEVKFIPGLIIDDNFVPGQVVMTDSGEEFIPGQVIETSEGPKFVPGQIINYKGVSKFVPGQTVQTAEGPKFVPGQIVETKSGPTFIPGQVIFTDEGGSKFVPGEVVETSDGPRFVPGRVIESGDHVTFVPGQVVETSEGPKFVAPDLEGEDDDHEFTVQGFEINPEELKLLMPRKSVTSAHLWEMPIDSKMLRQLSEAGMGIGGQVNIDVPTVDVKSAPAMSTACCLSEKHHLDPVTTVKVSQILVAVVQLGKLGEIPGSSPECTTMNRILERVVHCKNDEEAYKLISNIIEKEFAGHIVENVDKLHSYITSKDSPLKRLNKLNILKEIINCHSDPAEIIDKLHIILSEEEGTVCYALQKLSETAPEIVPLIMERLSDTIEVMDNENDVIETLHRTIVATVREASEMNIVDLLKDTENLGLKTLILEAVGLAKALDMHDTACQLLAILSNPKCTNILAGDRLTLEILRRLTVMRQLAARRPELVAALKKLQKDPIEARSDPSLRQLVRESGALLVVPEQGISSQQVPASLFFSQNSLAMEDFLTRTKRMYSILVIIKNGIQAIIPREASHSVLTGSVPYVVLDEKGLHHFQPKHVFSALKLPKLCTNWFSSYKCEVLDTPLKSVIETN